MLLQEVQRRANKLLINERIVSLLNLCACFFLLLASIRYMVCTRALSNKNERNSSSFSIFTIRGQVKDSNRSVLVHQ